LARQFFDLNQNQNSRLSRPWSAALAIWIFAKRSQR